MCVYTDAHTSTQGFPCGSDNKESICNAGDQEEGNGYPPQYSCQESPMDRGAWWITVFGVTESDKTEQLGTFRLYIYTHTYICICILFTKYFRQKN